ncbi:hypothetical protein SZN_19375 [Streptomyces zinciresistens K42]|uniref:Uncharacterized protein n=1 Tax=Streptomyces zinciresistens K42 TaxID=700597 RepID=G2GEE2_9ACTN|nr:hypothetical protein [Streptomyces zinciresistens]EGX58117.1 hypothetical protein SZN_19375 [Streptomyces zinciresistens K42]
MTHRHKSGKAVEGDPEHRHDRCLPRRPDQDGLVRLTARERQEA